MDTNTLSSAHSAMLTADEVRNSAPAVFATSAHERTSDAYAFLSTERLLASLQQAGFLPINVRQTRTRRNSPLHARHMIRLRRRHETLQLRDSIPEIILINSHDGTTAYKLRFGLYRVICTNGLIVSAGEFAAFRVPHRGDWPTTSSARRYRWPNASARWAKQSNGWNRQSSARSSAATSRDGP